MIRSEVGHCKRIIIGEHCNGTKTVRCWLPYLVVCPLMSAFVNPYVLRIKQSMPGKRMEGKIWHTDAEGDDAEAGFAPVPLTC